jgi:hypothetical protein
MSPAQCPAKAPERKAALMMKAAGRKNPAASVTAPLFNRASSTIALEF